MGLDMYLTKRLYIGGNYNFNNVTGSVDIKLDGKSIEIPVNKIISIVLEGCYWRKANAIHEWFVKNCQDGVDDCRETYVSREKLEELLWLCKRVKLNPSLASELLPTQSGFFFGSTEYDEWYWNDIDDTIKFITELLKENDPDYEFYYCSSW